MKQLLIAAVMVVMLALPATAGKKSCKGRCGAKFRRCVSNCIDYSNSAGEARQCESACKVKKWHCRSHCK